MAWQARQDIPAAGLRKLALVRCPRCGRQTRELLKRKVFTVAFCFAFTLLVPLMALLLGSSLPRGARLTTPTSLLVATGIGAVSGLAIAATEWRRWSRLRRDVIFREDPAWGQFAG
jgi:hypothetical protein